MKIDITEENNEINYNYFNKENSLFNKLEYKSNNDEEYTNTTYSDNNSWEEALSTNCSLNSNEDKEGNFCLLDDEQFNLNIGENFDELNLYTISVKSNYVIEVKNNIKNTEISSTNNFHKLNINAKPFIPKKNYVI